MRLAVLLGLAALPVLAAAVELNPASPHDPVYAPLKPFVATYDVQRGGKTIGEATMTLKADGGDNWTLITQTRGTAGMAKLFGLDVKEESHFTAARQAPLQSTAYSYQQEATLKSKQRRIEFDWAAKEARVTDKDELFRYPLQPYSIDRHAVVIALGRKARVQIARRPQGQKARPRPRHQLRRHRQKSRRHPRCGGRSIR